MIYYASMIDRDTNHAVCGKYFKTLWEACCYAQPTVWGYGSVITYDNGKIKERRTFGE